MEIQRLQILGIQLNGDSSDGRGTLAAGEWVQITTDTPDIQTGGTRGILLVVGNEPSPNQTFELI